MKINFQRKQTLPSIASYALFFLLLTSCGKNIPSVEQLEQMTGKLKNGGTNIAADIYDSCIRRTKHIAFVVAPNSAGSFNRRRKEEQTCENSNDRTSAKIISKRTAVANAIVSDYIGAVVSLALGKNSKNKKISFDDSLGSLRESLKKIQIPDKQGNLVSLLKDEEVNAGIGIIKFLTENLTKDYRRRKLKQVILCTDKYIQTYIGVSKPNQTGLIGITQEYIDGILRQEENQVRRYYIDYIGLLGTPQETYQKNNVLDFIKLEKHYDRSMDEIRSKRKSAEAYIKTLQSIAKMHAKLKEEFASKKKNKLSGPRLEKYCQNAFKSESEKTADKSEADIYTIEELRRAENIVSEYTKVLQPLLNQVDRSF